MLDAGILYINNKLLVLFRVGTLRNSTSILPNAVFYQTPYSNIMDSYVWRWWGKIIPYTSKNTFLGKGPEVSKIKQRKHVRRYSS